MTSKRLTERDIFIARQRRWIRLVRRGDWKGMAAHIKACQAYDLSKKKRPPGRRDNA